MQRPSIIERAFELADTGRLHTLEELEKALARESYEAVRDHLSGSSIRAQLKARLRSSMAARGAMIVPGGSKDRGKGNLSATRSKAVA